MVDGDRGATALAKKLPLPRSSALQIRSIPTGNSKTKSEQMSKGAHQRHSKLVIILLILLIIVVVVTTTKKIGQYERTADLNPLGFSLISSSAPLYSTVDSVFVAERNDEWNGTAAAVLSCLPTFVVVNQLSSVFSSWRTLRRQERQAGMSCCWRTVTGLIQCTRLPQEHIRRPSSPRFKVLRKFTGIN